MSRCRGVRVRPLAEVRSAWPTSSACGELLIDFVPTVTGLDLGMAEMFKKAAGGAPANVAVGLVRFGVASAFMGKVGDDGFGRFLAGTLADAGVDIGPLRIDRAGAHGARLRLAEGGRRARVPVLPHPQCRHAVRAGGCRRGRHRRRAKLLHFGSISLISEPSRSATLHAVAAANRHGRRVSYDPNLRLALWPSEEAARAGARQGLREADIVKIGTEELHFLTGESDYIAAARSLWHPRLKLMAVTRGRDGSHWLTPNADGAVPGFAVAAIDTTGAGDAFMAGFIAGLLAEGHLPGEPSRLDAVCRLANAAGALTAMGRGAIPSLPSRGDVLAFLERATT